MVPTRASGPSSLFPFFSPSSVRSKFVVPPESLKIARKSRGYQHAQFATRKKEEKSGRECLPFRILMLAEPWEPQAAVDGRTH